MNDIEYVDYSLGQISEEEKERMLNYYRYDVESNVFIAQSYKKPIDYADGSEEYLEKVFEELPEFGSEQNTGLQKYIVNWPSRYHLSGMRVNLLEAVTELFKPDWNALELGGGMGAVTPWLAKRFQTVDVVEGSLLRAKVLRRRVQDVNNVEVFVDDLLQVAWPRPAYDFISLLGVLEYLPYFSDTAAPEQVCINFLQKVNKTLTADGILAIAIENKLGAKYFSGCSEDHNGRLFSGLIGYPEKSAITFSRYELLEILKKAGFIQIQFYHLFPDYKLPKVVIREDPSMYDFNVGGIMRGLFEDYTGRREYLMPDPLLLTTLSKARLLHEMSNSFLVLCSKSEVANLKTQAVMTKFWNNDITKPMYHHKIEFCNTPVKSVKRVSLEVGQREVSVAGLQFCLAADEPFIEGESLISAAYRAIMRRDGYSSLHELLKVLRQQLIAAYGTGRNDEEGYQLISGQAVDYCFNNLIRTEAQIAFIDRKWALESEISEDYVMFRSLFELFKEMFPFIQESKASEFVVKLMNKIFPQYNYSRFDSNLDLESKFQSLVNIRPVICADIDIDAGKKALELQKK
ncbi:hypothetical protein SRRS_50020 [Sporomusa rhizae]|uniref:class I SAM-dependent methyltransferase n=1 Tax=Sporomusa rhizae TaxID=357999 RepID=UPI00352AAAD7